MAFSDKVRVLCLLLILTVFTARHLESGKLLFFCLFLIDWMQLLVLSISQFQWKLWFRSAMFEITEVNYPAPLFIHYANGCNATWIAASLGRRSCICNIFLLFQSFLLKDHKIKLNRRVAALLTVLSHIFLTVFHSGAGWFILFKGFFSLCSLWNTGVILKNDECLSWGRNAFSR